MRAILSAAVTWMNLVNNKTCLSIFLSQEILYLFKTAFFEIITLIYLSVDRVIKYKGQWMEKLGAVKERKKACSHSTPDMFLSQIDLFKGVSRQHCHWRDNSYTVFAFVQDIYSVFEKYFLGDQLWNRGGGSRFYDFFFLIKTGASHVSSRTEPIFRRTYS